jgi:large subunit ribosomal protein L6
MSRIAKKPIILPKSVSIENNNKYFVIKGSLGTLLVPVFPEFTISINHNSVSFVQDVNYKKFSDKAGLLRTLLNNAVLGVTTGYSKTLELKGLGYRCNIEQETLFMSLGFSHKVKYAVPSDVKISIEKDTIIIIKGLDKQRVGQVAADIRRKKIPDNYHAKGILYQGEVIITKEGKKK